MKVLVVDDDPVSRKLLQRYLERWEYQFDLAVDGQQAWERFQAADYPIVITDWIMPEMDGIELIRRIRASEQADCVYTILLTARSQKEDLVEGMEAGADDFVTKPFDRDELRVRLREGERIVRLERELAQQNRQLREGRADLQPSPTPAAPTSTVSTGVDIGRVVQRPLDELAEDLTELRRQLSAFRNVLHHHRQTCDRLAAVNPELRADLEHTSMQLDEIGLDSLFEKAVESLQQVRHCLNELNLARGQ